VHPIALPTVPWPPCIITAPVIAETECHDSDTQIRSELEYGHATVLVVVVQIIAVDPATVALPVHIAPGPIVETAVDVQRGVGRQGEHQRIVGARSGTQVYETLGVRDTRPGGRAKSDGHKGEERKRQTFHKPPNLCHGASRNLSLSRIGCARNGVTTWWSWPPLRGAVLAAHNFRRFSCARAIA
jgi:hypothetical protein